MADLALATQNGAGGFQAQSVLNSKVIDTPRTREACRRLGLVLEDLQPRGMEAFAIPGDLKEKQKLRFEHFEKKRRDRFALVMAERAKVIDLNAKKGEVPGVQSAQFLGMLESLFEKEAKRLEGDLKNQLRAHSSLVKENEEQLRQEENQFRREQTREMRKMAADKIKNEVGAKTKEKNDDRTNKNNAENARLQAEFEDKQAKFALAVVAEEDRLERFMQEKGQLSAEKSAHWREKVENMKKKNQDMVVQRRIDGEIKLGEIEARLNHVAKNREDELMKRQLQSEMQQLHIMDVRQQKDRLDRVDGYRRDELKDQIDSNVERIETLLALKDQLLDQRKARTAKAEATKGSRGLNLRRDCLPGPGQYEAPPSCMQEKPVPKIAQTKTGHSEFIDAQTRVTAANPAPGAYDARVLPNGDRVDEPSQKTVQFGNRNRDSFLDDAMKAKDFVPAPGRYESKSQLAERATKMRRDAIKDEGLDKFSAKRFPDWARPPTDTPGPAGYSVDEYTRKDVLRRAQKSMPNLTKDMLRPRPAASR